METAQTIAERFCPSDAIELERAILRHMEHHMAMEREACAQVPLSLAVAGEIDPAIAELVQDKIRNRT